MHYLIIKTYIRLNKFILFDNDNNKFKFDEQVRLEISK